MHALKLKPQRLLSKLDQLEVVPDPADDLFTGDEFPWLEAEDRQVIRQLGSIPNVVLARHFQRLYLHNPRLNSPGRAPDPMPPEELLVTLKQVLGKKMIPLPPASSEPDHYQEGDTLVVTGWPQLLPIEKKIVTAIGMLPFEFAPELQLIYIESQLLKSDLTESEARFALAMMRLVQDIDERRSAEFDGFAFQRKYKLSNHQMMLLAACAVGAGEVHARWEAAQIEWDLSQHGDGPGDNPVGSCSCCCP